MTEGTLLTHCGAHRVTREELEHIPTPEPIGPRHKPVPHFEFVETLSTVLGEAKLRIRREEFAVYRGGKVIFGVMDLASDNGLSRWNRDGQGFSLGIRGSNAGDMSLQIAAGQRVFVCDNLCFSGDMIALKRKHTTGLVLKNELEVAIIRYLDQVATLVWKTDKARENGLPDAYAKELIFDQFAKGVVPVRLFPKVVANYFSPAEEAEDCQGRTLWSLHNSFTREVKNLSPAVRFRATARLGKLLDAV